MLTNMSPRSIADIANFHAHVYYDADRTRGEATTLHGWIAERFRVHLSPMYDTPVGPHPVPMFEVAFEVPLYGRLVPWLSLNRLGLSVLVHPNTERVRDDHLVQPAWLGARLTLLVDGIPELSHNFRTAPVRPIEPNTTPTAIGT